MRQTGSTLAFVESYSTARIPRSGIPKVSVTFGWPRLNGQKVELKKASASYPDPAGDTTGSPDGLWVKARGENCVGEIGPIFKRNEARRRHGLLIQTGPESATGDKAGSP